MSKVNRVITLMIVSMLVVCGYGNASGATQETARPAKVRLAWINTVPTIAQYVEVLRRTNVAEKYGLDITLFPFQSAAPVASAAAAGSVDQYLGSDIALAGILARGERWTIVAGSVGWRFGFAVQDGSPIKNLADLRGKKVSIPFGVSTQIYLLEALKQAGLNPGSDVTVVNVAINQIGSALQGGAVAAVGGWDPGLSAIKDSHLIYADVAGTGKKLPSTVIAFPTKMAEEQRDVVVKTLAATIQSIWYVIQHKEQTAGWASKVTQAPLSVVKKAFEQEPLFQAKQFADINIELTPAAIEQMDRNEEFFVSQKLMPKAVEMKQHWDNSIAKDAEALAQKQGPLQLTVSK